MRKLLSILVLATVLSAAQEAKAMAIGPELLAIFGGGGGAAYVAYRLFNQPWMSKVCYFVADEAALRVMPKCSAQVDNDAIATCGICIQYMQTANGVPAATINANLAAALANLPPDVQAYFQEAAKDLDDFLPPATSMVVLTSNQINDIIGFLQGWADGTTTCRNNLPALLGDTFDGARPHSVKQDLLHAQSKLSSLREKHPPKDKVAGASGGWFKVQK